MSGLDVIRAVREYASTPIIVLSARSGSSDKVAALDLGADDYVTKPFSVDELLARLRATARRAATPDDQVVAIVGDAKIDLAMTTALRPSGEAVHLTPTEWKILDVLLRHPGKLISSDTLLTALRGSAEHTDPSYLRIYLAQLRRKLEPEPSRPRHLITEPGMGYRYRP
jgi:two-component system, OmpR family, KDP operon response regulator KdpE